MIDWTKIITAEDKLVEAEKRRIENLKVERRELVAAILVTTSTGKVFDGDEKSQDRMSRAISALIDGETTTWVLANNTVATVTKEELREALRLAGAEQTRLWALPYNQGGTQ